MIAGAGSHQPIGKNGKFAIFPDYATGFNAMVQNLYNSTYYNLTVGEAIVKWAPEEAGNDPATYANHVHTWTGISADTMINTLTANQMNSVARAIQRQEGWATGNITHVHPQSAGK